jgi:hypothetical protein
MPLSPDELLRETKAELERAGKSGLDEILRQLKSDIESKARRNVDEILRQRKTELERTGRLNLDANVQHVREAQAFPPVKITLLSETVTTKPHTLADAIGGDQQGSGAFPVPPGGDGPFVPTFFPDGTITWEEVGEC